MFDRDIRVTVLGNTGVGKTTLINRMIGTDVKKIVSKKTLEINIEEKKIKLKSSETYPWYSPEAHRKYRIIAIDNPGDYKLRRKWREAMRKFKTDGMLFLLDPDQSVEVQRVAMEDSYNYFLDSLDLKPEKTEITLAELRKESKLPMKAANEFVDNLQSKGVLAIQDTGKIRFLKPL